MVKRNTVSNKHLRDFSLFFNLGTPGTLWWCTQSISEMSFHFTLRHKFCNLTDVPLTLNKTFSAAKTGFSPVHG